MGNTCALVLASGLDAPSSIAVDETHLYVTTAAAVERLDHDGGGALTLAGSLPQPYAIELDATDLFWVDETKTISAMPKSGGTPRSIGSSSTFIQSISLDATSVYWNDASKVMKAPKTGGSTIAVATDAGTVSGIAVDHLSVYWSSYDGILSKRDHAAPASGMLAYINFNHSAPTVHDLGLYWLEYGPGPMSLATVDATAGGAPATLHVEPAACPDCMQNGLSFDKPVTDGVHVYWLLNLGTNEGGRYILYRTSLVAGTTERFADFYAGDQMGFADLALWGDHLYLSISAGWILKLEK